VPPVELPVCALLILRRQRDPRCWTYQSRRWRRCISGLVRAAASLHQLSITHLSADPIAAGQWALSARRKVGWRDDRGRSIIHQWGSGGATSLQTSLRWRQIPGALLALSGTMTRSSLPGSVALRGMRTVFSVASTSPPMVGTGRSRRAPAATWCSRSNRLRIEWGSAAGLVCPPLSRNVGQDHSLSWPRCRGMVSQWTSVRSRAHRCASHWCRCHQPVWRAASRSRHSGPARLWPWSSPTTTVVGEATGRPRSTIDQNDSSSGSLPQCRPTRRRGLVLQGERDRGAARQPVAVRSRTRL
jgi:hypothetical protein